MQIKPSEKKKEKKKEMYHVTRPPFYTIIAIFLSSETKSHI